MLISARQKVQLQFEDRYRLINAQIIFYKSSEQVAHRFRSFYFSNFNRFLVVLGFTNVGHIGTRISNGRRYS